MTDLVTTEWLANQLGSHDVRVVDATQHLPGARRDAKAEHTAAHIPGAMFMDLAGLADPAAPIENTLPSSATFTARIQALGLGEGSRIVLYDDSAVKTSARAWFLLKMFGARHVAILDGGLAKWRAEGRVVARGAEQVQPRRFAPEYAEGRLRDRAAVLANIATDHEQLVDARSRARFTGAEADPRPGIAAGHIPGSLNLPHGEMFAADGTWNAASELRAAFGAAGIDLTRPIVTSCGSGITACVLLFALHLLGHRDNALYDGSWSEWGADPALPKVAAPSALG